MYRQWNRMAIAITNNNPSPPDAFRWWQKPFFNKPRGVIDFGPFPYEHFTRKWQRRNRSFGRNLHISFRWVRFQFITIVFTIPSRIGGVIPDNGQLQRTDGGYDTFSSFLISVYDPYKFCTWKSVGRGGRHNEGKWNHDDENTAFF